MPLFNFPPDILYPIFDELDPSFFREDLARLTVSKQWYQYALPRLLSEVWIPSTERLLATAADDEFLAKCESHVRSADITIDTPIHYRPSPSVGNGCDDDDNDDDDKIVVSRGERYRALLSFLERRCPRLWSLRLHMALDKSMVLGYDEHIVREVEHAYIALVSDTLAVCAPRRRGEENHITCLDIDLTGGRSAVGLSPVDRKFQAGDGNLCVQLRRLLPRLKRLRCRMDRICTRLLPFDSPASGDSESDVATTAEWPLEEMILNLSLQGFSTEGTTWYDPRIRPPCRVPVNCLKELISWAEPWRGATQLRERIQLGMADLVRDGNRPRNLRMLRVIWDDYHHGYEPSVVRLHPDMEGEENSGVLFDVLAWDALPTKRTVRLGPDLEWDAVGELVDDRPRTSWD